MDQTQLSQTAQKMFLEGAGRKSVIEFLTANGVSESEVDNMATTAYRAIKSQRQSMLKQKHEEQKPIGGGGSSSMVIGAFFIIAGIVLTISTDRIWYGLMIVGAITLVKGLVDKTS